MVDPDRRPTAQEIEELIDLVRRDPASPAFIDLGEAYLALGRPRDAIQVGGLGLEVSPDNLEGRVMLARAHAALHQWKEAQGELLRVVKVDRSNRQGFALLGEVLLRRSDFERAVPVLQHAQNLDPTSPQILAMLRRARAGQALDPPNPIPQPSPPRGETDNRADIQRSRAPAPLQPPPRAAPPTASLKPRAAPPPPAPAMPAMAPMPMPEAPPPPAFAPAYQNPPPLAPPPPLPRGPKQTAPPPMSVEGIKPRIIASVKQQNAAAASLRQSAAVGESYLNDLLTGGLLDVAGVRVPDADYDLRPDRRWGRSTRRAFIFLFVVLVLGIGGGTTWYIFAEKQKNEAVAGLQEEAKKALKSGDYNAFVESLGKLQDALAKDPTDTTTFAYYVQAGGLASLLYGEVRIPAKEEETEDGKKEPAKEAVVTPDRVDAAYAQLTQGEEPLASTDPGYREMQIGRVALELSRLPGGLEKPELIKSGVEKLAEVNKTLDELLAKDKDDRWARWLKGRALLAAGDRRGAAAELKTAADGDQGLVIARIDEANLLVDDGKTDAALAMFKTLLERPDAKDHQLALIGESLARVEGGVDYQKVTDSLAKFAVTKLPPRLAAQFYMVQANLNIAQDYFADAAEALTKAYLGRQIACRGTPRCTAHPIAEPRFWARMAWLHYKLGRPAKVEEGRKSDLAAAGDARKHCIWFAKAAEPDPTVDLIDAALLLASGLPEKVVDKATKLQGIRPKVLQAYAAIDLGKPKDAITLADEVLKAAGEANDQPCGRDADKLDRNYEIKALCEQATMAGTDKERKAAADWLGKLAGKNKNQIPRHIQGVALLAVKDAPPLETTDSNLALAKKSLDKADSTDPTSPNPLIYRTLTARAEVALIEKDIELAGKTLDRALDANAGYFPTLALQARIVLRNKEPEKALGLLEPILRESAAVTPSVQLTFAEALVTRKSSAKDKEKDKDQAKKLLADLKGKPGVTDEELGRIAALIDPKLPEELGVPAPEDPDKPDDKKKDPKKPPTPPRRR